MNRIGLHITNGTRLPLVGARGRPRIVKLHNCSVEYKRQVRAEANQQIAAANGAIGELEALLEPEPEAEKEAE